MRKKKNQRSLQKLRTMISIESVSVPVGGQMIAVNLTNKGQEIIREPSGLLLFSDVVSQEWIEYDKIPGWNYSLTNSHFNPIFWDPDEELVIYINLDIPLITGYHRITIATTNGITDSYLWDYQN